MLFIDFLMNLPLIELFKVIDRNESEHNTASSIIDTTNNTTNTQTSYGTKTNRINSKHSQLSKLSKVNISFKQISKGKLFIFETSSKPHIYMVSNSPSFDLT